MPVANRSAGHWIFKRNGNIHNGTADIIGRRFRKKNTCGSLVRTNESVAGTLGFTVCAALCSIPAGLSAWMIRSMYTTAILVVMSMPFGVHWQWLSWCL